MKKQTDYPSYKNRVWQKVLYSKLKDNLDTCGLMEVPKEATSPEDYFDNGLIRDTIDSRVIWYCNFAIRLLCLLEDIKSP